MAPSRRGLMRSRAGGLVRFFAIGAVVMSLAGVLWGLNWTDDYIQNDPGFCGLCHRPTPEFASLDHGEHQELRCQQCHHTGQDQGLGLLRAFLTSTSGGTGIQHAAVEVGACKSCHLSHDRKWVQVGASRGHQIHVEQEQIPCASCHLEQGHQFVPTLGSCKECHGQHFVNTAGMQKLHCFACHDFLSVQDTLLPSRRDCLRCHRDEGLHPSRFPLEAPMLFACAECHRPHVPPEQEHVACASCHEGIERAELHSLPAHQRCDECHRPHGWTSSQDDCLRCHPATASHHEGSLCSGCHRWGGAAAPLPPKGSPPTPATD